MQKLSLKQNTQQKLTPQQIHFLKLLQTSNANLQATIEKELAKNPVLEKVEETTQAEDIPEEATEIYGTTKLVTHPPMRHRKPGTSLDDFVQAQSAEAPSFRENLLQQVQFLSLTQEELSTAKYLIGSLTEAGYLSRPLKWIVAEMSVIHNQETDLATVERILKIIQKIGPPGIGARNLQEALLLQLQAQKATATVQQAIQILSHDFEAFQKKHHAQIAAKYSFTPKQLQDLLQTIGKLNPYPISPASEKHVQNILEPDFIVTLSQGKLHVELIERRQPKLRMNAEYQGTLQKHKHEKTAHSREIVQFVQAKTNQAKYFMQAIEQRKQTLLQIMQTLLKLQQAFFQSGDPMQLVPILLRNVAKQIHMNVSTISRAIRHKSVQTPWGIYPLKYFFSRAVPTKKGKQVSSHLVKQTLTHLMEMEDKKKPYNDEALAAMLQQKGFQIARRTVAKYREQLGILPARLRKAWV